MQPCGERAGRARRARGPPRRAHVLERLAVPPRVPRPHADRCGLGAAQYPDGGRGPRLRGRERRGDRAGGRPRSGGARPAPREPGQGAGPPRGGRAARRRHPRVGRVARRRLPALPAAPARPGLGLHAAVHVRLDRQAQGRPPGPPGPGVERRHHPEDGVSRRHRARARRRAPLPQERDDRRGEAVPPRGRVARHPPRLRPRRGDPRHRPPQGDLPHRRAGHVQAHARREGHPRAATASARSATRSAGRPRCRRSS